MAAAELADDDGVAQLALGQVVGGLDGRLVQTHQELAPVLAQVTTQALVVCDDRAAGQEAIEALLEATSLPGEGRVGELVAAGAEDEHILEQGLDLQRKARGAADLSVGHLAGAPEQVAQALGAAVVERVECGQTIADQPAGKSSPSVDTTTSEPRLRAIT